MRIGFYCPLIGAKFLKSLHMTPVDLRAIEFANVNYNSCQFGSNTCCLIRSIASFISGNRIIDGIILTNCCPEQEQLADTLSNSNIKVYMINIPRKFNEDSIKYLFDQIKNIGQQIGNGINGIFDLNTYLHSLIEERIIFQPNPDFLPVYVSGISIPLWFESLLNTNKLGAVIRRKCNQMSISDLETASNISPENLDLNEISRYFSCMRDISPEAEIISLKKDINTYSPVASIFVSMEFCTTSSYYYMKYREQFQIENIPVFKITISDWSKPTANVVNQIETIAQMCWGKRS